MLQTRYRTYAAVSTYLHTRKCIMLLQSIIRMVPKLFKFRVLKYWTIKMQSWTRRTIIRKWYLLILKSCLIIQTYVRRYLTQKYVWNFRKKLWLIIENSMAAVIRIQCRIRIFKAKKKIQLIRYNINKFENAALAIQRNWYQSRNEYSSYFLMRAYKAKSKLDEKEVKRKKLNSIAGKAEIIQRNFRKFLRKRFLQAAITIQKYFRRFVGNKFVQNLRCRKINGRKIRIWLKFCMKRRHNYARTIQRIWWSLRKGRLIDHLYGEQLNLILELCYA